MNRSYFIIFCMILLCSFAFASTEFLGTFKTGEEINLIQTCSSCSYNNISIVTAPDSTIVLSNVAMTKSDFTYNYTLSSQSQAGTYNVCGVGDLDGETTAWCYTFDLTHSGQTRQNLLIPIIIMHIFGSALYFWFGRLNQQNIKMDSTKLTTYIVIMSYGMIILKVLSAPFFIYQYYSNNNIGNMISYFLWGDLIILGGIAIFTIMFVVLGFFSPNMMRDNKWEPRKW